MKVSLKTRDPKRALRLARLLSYAGHVVTETGVGRGMRYDEIRAVLRKHFVGLLEGRMRHMDEVGPLPPLDAALVAQGRSLAEEALAGSSSLSLVSDDADLLGRFIAKYELPIVPSQPTYPTLRTEFYRAYRDYCDEVLRRNDRLGHYDYTDPADTGLDVGGKASRETGTTVGELVDKYLAAFKVGSKPAVRTESQKRSNLALLVEILGSDTDLASIGYQQAQLTAEVLQNYPKNRSKYEPISSKNILTLQGELPGFFEDGTYERISNHTRNVYLQTYSGLFHWAKRRGYVSENYFSGLTERTRKTTKARSEFARSQIETLIAELVTNRLGLVTKHYRKWVTLLAIYTGARLNELCQICLTDVKQIEGYWCLDLNDEGDLKSLKTNASHRIVPVHSQLLELGFLDYVEQVRTSGADRLFPELTYSTKHGWGRAQSRWFNDQFLVELGLKTKELVFHSFRKTMSTALLRASVEEALVQWIVGHERTSVTQVHYHAGYTVKQKVDAVELVRYNLP